MSIAEMKKALKGVYTGLKWQAKVEKMSDKQIIAVYYKMLNEGKIK